jgi:outer membrane murein-binding lipoprotein Lpp
MTLRVLNEIRSDVRGLTERVDRLEVGFAALAGDVSALAGDVSALAGEVVAMHGTLREVRDVLVARREDRGRLDDHEERLQKLEKNVG